MSSGIFLASWMSFAFHENENHDDLLTLGASLISMQGKHISFPAILWRLRKGRGGERYKLGVNFPSAQALRVPVSEWK